jgi:hypothetical protein
LEFAGKVVTCLDQFGRNWHGEARGGRVRWS